MRISDWSSDVCSSDLNQCISDTFRGRRRPFWHIVFVDNHGPHAFDEIRAADDMAGNAIFHPHIVREIRHPSALRQLAAGDFDGLWRFGGEGGYLFVSPLRTVRLQRGENVFILFLWKKAKSERSRV